jgi:small subunit ribosomal protein S1
MEPENPTPEVNEVHTINENSPTTETTSEESNTTLKVGDTVVGTITKRVHQMVFIALEQGSEAYISISELRDENGEINVTLGQQVEGKVKNLRSGVELTREYLIEKQALDALEKAFNDKTQVQGKVTKINKGGYEVRVGSISAFCPKSHFSLRPERAPQQQVGKVLDFVIEEFKRGKRARIVVSRRPILEAVERDKAQLIGERFTVGEVIQGQISQLSKVGVFVDVGDEIEGLIPLSELSHSRVNRASNVVTVGDSIEVKVINVDSQRGRLSLSIRQLTSDPWDTFVETNGAGTQVTGTITRILDFGAFVKLTEAVEGLLHISAITTRGRLNHPSEHVSVGQELEVVIEEVIRSDRNDRRKIRLMTPEVAERRKPIDIKIKVNEVITAPVKEVTDRGVILAIASNLDGFIPAPETGTARGANLSDRFPVGKEIQAKVMTIDLKRARVRLSVKALENHEEQMAFKQFKKEMREDQVKMTSTFGDLLKNFK